MQLERGKNQSDISINKANKTHTTTTPNTINTTVEES